MFPLPFLSSFVTRIDRALRTKGMEKSQVGRQEPGVICGTEPLPYPITNWTLYRWEINIYDIKLLRCQGVVSIIAVSITLIKVSFFFWLVDVITSFFPLRKLMLFLILLFFLQCSLVFPRVAFMGVCFDHFLSFGCLPQISLLAIHI